MIFLLETLLETMHILEALNRPAALLGGLAVSAWTNPRFTNDVDLAVAVTSDEDAEQTIYSIVVAESPRAPEGKEGEAFLERFYQQ